MITAVLRKRVRGGLIPAALVLLLAGPVRVNGQGQAPRQLPLFPLAAFRGVTAPSRYFYLSQAVVEYGPGAVSSVGMEQSTRFFTVIEGELTFTVGGKTDTFGAGKSFPVPPNVEARGSNEGRAARARVFISSLVPARGEGAVILTAANPSSGGPRTLYAARRPVGPLPAVIDVMQAGTRYEPGFVTPPHVMNETHAIMHLEGTTTYEYLDGAQDAFGPGQAGQMYVGRPGVMANRTAAPAVFLITWLVTPGKPLTSPWTLSGH